MNAVDTSDQDLLKCGMNRSQYGNRWIEAFILKSLVDTIKNRGGKKCFGDIQTLFAICILNLWIICIIL